MEAISLEPGSFNLCGRNKEPGTHCLRMLQIAQEFRRDRKVFFIGSSANYISNTVQARQ